MRKFLKTVSYVFQPLLMPTYGAILLTFAPPFQILGTYYRALLIIGTFLFTGLLPALPILMMMRRGQIKDLFISKREERTMPYLFSFLSYVFWVIFLWRTLQLPPQFVAIGVGTVLSLISLVFINLKWKISAHAAGVGGFIGSLLAASWLLSINPIALIIISLLVSALVSISRIYLKAHTLSQVIAGFSLAAGTVFLTVVIYSKFLLGFL